MEIVSKKLYGLPKLKNVLLVAFVAMMARKIYIGDTAMQYVETCSSQVDLATLMSNEHLQEAILSLSSDIPRLILIQNRHALNMTFNWLCNTIHMADVHGQVVIVTLDDESNDQLRRHFPSISLIHLPIPCLYDPFNYGDGRYQLFYLFRANLARMFLHLNRPFWMIQQDTFWYRNLLELNVTENENETDDIVFDLAMKSEKGSLIAGGYYFARPTVRAKAYFKRLARDLAHLYVPDNTYMTHLCALPNLAKCGHMSFSVVTNWIWLRGDSSSSTLPATSPENVSVPYLIQFDGDTRLGGKLQNMKNLGFYFLSNNQSVQMCNQSAVHEVENLVALRHQKLFDPSGAMTYSHMQFALYQYLIDQLYKTQVTRWFLNNVVFVYAHYFMLTL